jgi:hydrogenase maturation protease
MKCVLGLGNPILSDDGVGIHIVRAAAARWKGVARSADAVRLADASVEFQEASAGGLRLLEVIAGYDRLILVDAIQTPDGAPGRIHRLSSNDLRASLHAGSTHDLSFQGALAWGRQIGMALPPDDAITIIAVEAEDVLTFGEALTPAVAAALPAAVEAVLAELARDGS